jgi:hypothetical protein
VEKPPQEKKAYSFSTVESMRQITVSNSVAKLLHLPFSFG